MDNFDQQLKQLADRNPKILGYETSFNSAVLLPLVCYQDEECILFEKRAMSLDHQPGEICFPGGKIEKKDQHPGQTAVRETCEELGLNSSQVKVLAPLDVLVSPFGLIVHPYLGRIDERAVIKPGKDEVEHVFCVPLSHLQSTVPLRTMVSLDVVPPEDYPWELIPGGRDYPWRRGYYAQVFYEWQGNIIWGLTARILEHFLTLLDNKPLR